MAAEGSNSEAHDVLVVQMGGTIDKDYPSPLHGYAFEIADPAAKRVLANIATANPDSYAIATVAKKDSTDLTTEDRASLVATCLGAAQQLILVTHGTSTIVATARALAAGGVAKSKCVVLTGALLPERFKQSDAAFNIGFAMGVLQQMTEPGIRVCMSGRSFDYREVARDVEGHFVHVATRGAVPGDDPGMEINLREEQDAKN